MDSAVDSAGVSLDFSNASQTPSFAFPLEPRLLYVVSKEVRIRNLRIDFRLPALQMHRSVSLIPRSRSRIP